MLDTLLILGTLVADINRIISNKEFQGKKNEIHVIMRSVFLKLYELFGRREQISFKAGGFADKDALLSC